MGRVRRIFKASMGAHFFVQAEDGIRDVAVTGVQTCALPIYRMSFAARLQAELEQFKQEGVYKRLNYLEAPQAARTKMQGRGEVVILSSNNYLGLCNQPEVVAGGKRALEEFGAGTGSVRFICGTFTIHRELESALARLVGCEAALSYVSCWN